MLRDGYVDMSEMIVENRKIEAVRPDEKPVIPHHLGQNFENAIVGRFLSDQVKLLPTNLDGNTRVCRRWLWRH
jgi:hypothetical protein